MSKTKALLNGMQSLALTNGTTLEFKGDIFAETSWHDEESQKMTRQRIYTSENTSVYSILEDDGVNRVHNAYELSSTSSSIHLSNGKAQYDLPHDMFTLFIKSLLDKADAENSEEYTLEHIEELLKAVNC